MSTTPQPTPQHAETPRRSKQSSRSTIEERKRATRACDQCRRLKEKCEGGNPCRRCTHSRRACEFKSIASQGHDVRSHPRNSRAANGNSRELQERLMYMERILKHKFEGISLDTNSLCRMAESITGDGSTADQSEDAYTEEADDLAIEEEVCTIDPIEDTTTHYSGEFSYWNFSMRIKRHIDDRMTTSNSPAPPVSDQVPVYWRAGQLNSGSNSLTAAISCCPPRHIAGFLVDIFFKYAERHCFYVDKNWLLERLDMLYNNPGNFTTKSASTISIILTVLAIGTQYAYLDSPKQNTSGNSGPVFSEDEVGTMFYQQAIRLLPEIIESSSLESVQACLLFGVYALPIDASGLGYIYINLAVRLAMQNGMHRKYAGEALSPAMIETRNRVWWTAYTLERKISIFHGRPLSTHRSDVDSDLPKEQGDLQDDNAVSNVSHMLASIHLTQRLEDCFNKISLLRNCRKQELPAILSDLIAMKRALETWWSTLPNELLDDKAKPQAQFRATMHLRLEYSLIRMFIGRPFLFHRASSSQSDYNSLERHENTSPTDVPQGRTAPTSNSQKPGSSRAELVDDCIHAAEEALGICRSLRDSGSGLARASYIEYSSCRASLLVLIAYSIQNQSDQFRQPLKDGLDMIRDMSAAGDSARSEVLLIEALRRALIRLHSFGTKNSREDESSSATRSLTSGYDSFKHWESMWKSGAAVSTPLNSSRLMNNQAAASASFLPRSRASDQNSQDWSMDGINQMGDPSFGDPTGDGGRSFQSSSEMGFFGEGTMPMSSGWPGLPETQVLEEFLAIPQYMFDSGTAGSNAFGNMGSAPP